jgi:hypothetical protein
MLGMACQADHLGSGKWNANLGCERPTLAITMGTCKENQGQPESAEQQEQLSEAAAKQQMH